MELNGKEGKHEFRGFCCSSFFCVGGSTRPLKAGWFWSLQRRLHYVSFIFSRTAASGHQCDLCRRACHGVKFEKQAAFLNTLQSVMKALWTVKCRLLQCKREWRLLIKPSTWKQVKVFAKTDMKANKLLFALLEIIDNTLKPTNFFWYL